MSYVIALDLSTTATGVAAGKPHEYLEHLLTIRPAPGETQDRIIDVAMQVRALYAEVVMVKQCKPVVVMESLSSVRNARTTRVLAQLHGAVMMALRDAGCAQVMWVHQATAKRFLGVKGGKVEVMKRVKALGYAPSNHDESDALAVWLAHREASHVG